MKEQPPLPNRYLIDFDNTLSDTIWNPVSEKWQMGAPIKDVVEAVRKVSEANEIVIFTARPVSEWDEMRRWLRIAKVPYNAIQSKPLGVIVDDRALRPDEFVESMRKKK